MLKPEDNPPILWPEDKSLEDFTGQWLVAHTKSRNEKALAQDFISKGIGYFLPMSWKIRHQRGRKIRSLMPLFGGYVFFCGNENQRLEALRTNRIANIIPVEDQQRFISEICGIAQALQAGVVLEPHNFIKKGQKCRIISGPLMNLKGVVIQSGNTAHVVLQVDMLGQAASVEVDTDLIEIVDESAE